jgi:hypothetical protein
MAKEKRKEIRKELVTAATKRRKIREALKQASQWEDSLTERQRSKIPYSQARDEVIRKIYKQIIKDLL